jgi:hypothetical protein
MKMILNTKVSHQQLEECILKATGQPVCVDVAEDSDGSQMNKLEIINDKVHAMAQEIQQHKLNEQLFAKNLKEMEDRLAAKIEDSNINIQVV